MSGILGDVGGSLLTVLAGLGPLGHIQAGNAEARSLRFRADQADLNARLERLDGRKKAQEVQRQLESLKATNTSSFAARGVLASGGTADAARSAADANANRAIEELIFGSEIAAGNQTISALIARSDARNAKLQGYIRAGQQIGQGFQQVSSLGLS